jgi:hypothetical protein
MAQGRVEVFGASSFENLPIQVDYELGSGGWTTVVDCAFEHDTLDKALRLARLVKEQVFTLKNEMAHPARTGTWELAPGSQQEHQFDLAKDNLLKGLQVCQKYLELVAASQLAPGPSVGRGIMLTGILVVEGVPDVKLKRWVTEPDQQTLQTPDATPLALMDFVEGYLKELGIFDEGGWVSGMRGCSSQLCPGVTAPLTSLHRPAFLSEEGFMSKNKALLQVAGFPSRLDFDGVILSVEIPQILCDFEWAEEVSKQGVAVKAEQMMYLCPRADDDQNTSFWIEVNLKSTGTKIWAFRSIKAARGPTSTIKFCTLDVQYVVTGEKITLVPQDRWRVQPFQTCSPGGFDPVRAIVLREGARSRFLALVMQHGPGAQRKTLMHCDSLPANLHGDKFQPDWD